MSVQHQVAADHQTKSANLGRDYSVSLPEGTTFTMHRHSVLLSLKADTLFHYECA